MSFDAQLQKKKSIKVSRVNESWKLKKKRLAKIWNFTPIIDLNFWVYLKNYQIQSTQVVDREINFFINLEKMLPLN